MVTQRGHPGKMGDAFIGRIEDAVAEGEKSGESGVLDIGEQQIRNHGPAWPLRAARPRLNHWPPKEQRGQEEANVLDLVPGI